jgi:hypothetical protein
VLVLMLVLVQMLVQAEEQVEAQQRLVFLDKDQVNQHTAVPNVEANYGKPPQQVEAQ